MLIALLIPIIVSAVSLFFASFLAWMVLPIHRDDWKNPACSDELCDSLRGFSLAPGSYMFPGSSTPQERESPEFREKLQKGPVGVLTVFSGHPMRRNLVLTFLYFLAASFCLAYLATLGLPAGAPFMKVFRFVSTAGMMTFFSAIVPHSIWFQCRITGHLLESVVSALMVGAIFGAMWPAG